jgi:hypothetical protein
MAGLPKNSKEEKEDVSGLCRDSSDLTATEKGE